MSSFFGSGSVARTVVLASGVVGSVWGMTWFPNYLQISLQTQDAYSRYKMCEELKRHDEAEKWFQRWMELTNEPQKKTNVAVPVEKNSVQNSRTA